MSFKQIAQSLTDPQTRAGRRFDQIIHTLIVFSLIEVAVETVPEAQAYGAWLTWSEYTVVAVFTIEYALRFTYGGLKYAISFFGVIDLLAILPSYLSFGTVDLRAVRIFRLLRLLRLAKLHRYGSAWDRLRTAFLSIREELIVYCALTITLLYLSAVGIYYCEHDAQPDAFRSIPHAMWWAVATLTTVGYGDVYPVTIAGKLFTFIILLLGLSIVAIPSGLFASALVKRSEGDDAQKTE
jgi:voltage-gated potassium channel